MLMPGAIVGAWRVEAEIGAGSTAVVYRAHRLGEPDKVVAIKLLSVPQREIYRRMLREGRLAARLRHPHIVRVLEVLELDGRVGLVMEHVEGPSLRRWLQEHPQAPFQICDALARQIVEGVAHAHAAGVVHRDLKPANVLLQPGPRGLQPRISDFGLAKAMREGPGIADTHTGHALGTPRYMAPEQVLSAKHVDARADVFSLGCLLFELYSGQQTFPQRDVLSVFNAVLAGAHLDLADIAPELPERVLWAVRAALATEVADRPRHAGALLEILEEEELDEFFEEAPERIDVRLAAEPSRLEGGPGDLRWFVVGVLRGAGLGAVLGVITGVALISALSWLRP